MLFVQTIVMTVIDVVMMTVMVSFAKLFLVNVLSTGVDEHQHGYI